MKMTITYDFKKNKSLKMKSKLFFFLLFFLIVQICSAQKNRDQSIGTLTQEQFSDFKEFMLSKNLTIKDTIFLKYDFNRETCWNGLDGKDKEYIEKAKSSFQKQISHFNSKHKDAVAYNFREPGNRVNKLKLWDNTIIIDDRLFLKNLLFEKKRNCGTSVIILNDGSYLLYFVDPHFELLDKVYQKK